MHNEQEQPVIVQGPDTVMGVLAQFSTSAEGIAKFSQLVINEVEEGRVDPLDVAIQMKTLEKIVERVGGVLKKYYVSEAEKHGGKPFGWKGAEISVQEVGTKYDYSQCGDPRWNDLTKIIEQAIEQRKELEDFLKHLKGTTVEVIEGEAVSLRPPLRTSSTGIKISIR
jgi:hypothetical protein